MGNMTRRKFVETGAKTVALASIPFVFKLNPSAAFATPPQSPEKMAEYLTHFGVDEDLIRKTMAVALDHGGDYCDLYFQHAISNTIGLEDNLVNRAYSNVDFGVGIRVLKGDQTGFSFTEEITPEAMKLAAATAANIASGTKSAAPQPLKFFPTPDYYPIQTSWTDVKIDKKIPMLQTINADVMSRDSRVIKSSIWFIDQSSYVMVANSEGRLSCDFQPMTVIYVNCTAEQNGQREQSGSNYAGRDGIERFTPELVGRLGQQAVERTVNLFEAVKPDAGEMEVVLAAGGSGILLHEAIGHGMEADFNRKATSIFADKIGKPVAEKFVSIVDDGTYANARGAINIDDEGNDTEKTFLVENGILKSYLHDRISANYYGVQPTGNGRRQSFRFAPMPRMRSTYMLNGPHTPEEIIASVKKGIYAERFTNGEVRIGPGDFTFYVKSGYLIENGKLSSPIKDINIIGNGPDVLTKINMVGNDLKIDEGGWTCGKNGQSVPVSQGLPTVKVSSITVGGTA